jgi:hypothetical protein
VLVLTTLAFLVAAKLWEAIRRRFFPQTSAWANFFAILLIGLGNYSVYLLHAPAFYQVASASALLCLTAALVCVVYASGARSRATTGAWLSLASVAWGLAVGSRPNYLFTLPALGVVGMVFSVSRQDSTTGGRRFRLAPLLCAIAPAACIGLGLAYYNWVRFGDPMEFGIKYQFAAGDMRDLKLVSLSYIPQNLAVYLFAPCYHLRYFPFLEIRDAWLGTATWAPFALGVLLVPVTWFAWLGAYLRCVACRHAAELCRLADLRLSD